jgi:CRISPR-associated protein Cmr6
MFGTQKVRGKVIFLDAYPKNIPQLHIDIMNPHYGPYYSDGLPPADHHDPKPIKFLTVEAKTSFIFRAIAKKENDLPQKVHTAIVKALTEEGVGAKTAVGYGLFEVDEQSRGVLAQQNNNRQNLGANNDTFALPSAPKPVAATTELWHNATLSWNPGNDELSASFGGNKAIGKGKELLTDSLKAKLKKAKKIVTANVTVEIDGNKIQIIKVEPIE